MKKTAFWILVVSGLAILLANQGCRIINPSFDESSADSPISGVFATADLRITSSQGIDYSAGSFRFTVPPQALNQDLSIKVNQRPGSNNSPIPPKGWKLISDVYDIKPQGAFTSFLLPVKIQLPFSLETVSGGDTENVYFATRNDNNEWRFLPPTLDSSGKIGAIQTTHLSEWMVCYRDPSLQQTGIKSGPDLTTDPPILRPEATGKFSQDLSLNILFESQASLESLMASGAFQLFLRQAGGQELELINSSNGSTRTLKTLAADPDVIDLFTDPYVFHTTGNGAILFIVRLGFADRTTDQAPKNLVWRLLLKDVSGQVYEKTGQVSVTTSTKSVSLLSPSGSSNPGTVSFSWQFLPSVEDFTNATLQISFGRDFLIPLLEKELGRAIETYQLSAEEAALLKSATDYSWRIVATDKDGMTVTSDPLTFQLVEPAVGQPGGQPTGQPTVQPTGQPVGQPAVFDFYDSSPTTNSQNVLVDSPIRITFTKSIALASAQNAFSITPSVNGSISVSGTQLTFTHTQSLGPKTSYTVRVAKTLTDVSGAKLPKDVSITFVTEEAITGSGPRIVEISPADGSTTVTSKQAITLVFNQAMNQSTVESGFSLSPDLGGFTLNWLSDRSVSILGTKRFDLGTTYEATIASTTAAADGTPLGRMYRWRFTTTTQIDSTPPALVSISPASDSIGVPLIATISVIFDKALNRTSAKSSFSLTPAPNIEPVFTWTSDSVLDISLPSLNSGTTYQCKFSTALTDSAGNHLAADFVSGFTTVKAQGYSAPFEARAGAAALVFDNKLWVIGGRGANGLLNDVWWSSDGVNWASSTQAAGFTPRAGHACTVFKDKIFMTGGENEAGEFLDDVKQSADGSSWTTLNSSAEFYARRDHAMLVFNNALWILGGVAQVETTPPTEHILNDVWRSTDGTSWAATGTIAFYAHQEPAVVVLNNRMVLFTGYGKNQYGVPEYRKDIWSSTTDGLRWTQEADGPFVARRGAGYALHDNEAWLVGGTTPSGADTAFLNDAWSSADGINWSQKLADTDSPDRFSRRTGHCVVSFKGKLYIIGGQDDSGYLNDVWYVP